jgi:hypothetical protein
VHVLVLTCPSPAVLLPCPPSAVALHMQMLRLNHTLKCVSIVNYNSIGEN